MNRSAHRWIPNTDLRTGILALICFVALLGMGTCYQDSPTAPEAPAPTTTSTTTTTTTAATTTTTGLGTTTTTTTTTTTSGLVNYANQVHPIWGSQGCSAGGCHSAGGPQPNLSGSASDSCNGLATRDASSPNLIITGGGEDGSLILQKPNPSGVSHVGGGFNCFNGAGRDCYDTVLLWLQQGANGPGGTCGG